MNKNARLYHGLPVHAPVKTTTYVRRAALIPAHSAGSLGASAISALTSLEEFDLRLPEEHRVRGRQRDRPVDAEDRDLEFIAWLHALAQNDAVRHVEALDRRGAWPSRGARQLAVDPDFRVVVDGKGENDARPSSIQIADLRRNR